MELERRERSLTMVTLLERPVGGMPFAPSDRVPTTTTPFARIYHAIRKPARASALRLRATTARPRSARRSSRCHPAAYAVGDSPARSTATSDMRAGRRRSHAPARRRAARRAHHRARPRARRGRAAGAGHAGRDLAVQRRRPLHPRSTSTPRRSIRISPAPAASSPTRRATTASSPSSRAPIRGAITTMPGGPRTSISRCSATRSCSGW